MFSTFIYQGSDASTMHSTFLYTGSDASTISSDNHKRNQYQNHHNQKGNPVNKINIRTIKSITKQTTKHEGDNNRRK